VVTNDGTTSVAFGPGGKLYVGPKKGGMLVFDAEGRQIGKWLTKPFASGGGPNVYSIAPSPDGSIYLAQGNNSAWFMKLVPDEIEWNDSTKK
jgi:hypothetical protein